MKHIVLVLILAAAAVPVAASPSATAANEPVRIDFVKSISDPDHFVWTGTVSGDVSGGLTTRLTDLRVSGQIWHVRFDWIIDAGDHSFTADLSGTLNNRTGAVVMSRGSGSIEEALKR